MRPATALLSAIADRVGMIVLLDFTGARLYRPADRRLSRRAPISIPISKNSMRFSYPHAPGGLPLSRPGPRPSPLVPRPSVQPRPDRDVFAQRRPVLVAEPARDGGEVLLAQ